MNDWLNERIIDWLNKWSINWMNEWLNEWIIDCFNEWLNEWMNEWLNELLIEWLNEWMNDCMNEWLNEWMNEWMHMFLIQDGYQERAVWIYKYKSIVSGNKGREITDSQFKCNFKWAFKLQIYFTEITNLLQLGLSGFSCFSANFSCRLNYLQNRWLAA